MESSPLVKAHDHAHAAAVATRQASDTTVAMNEHTQAAGEFANAARNTSSVEALRTLKLLEEHHRKLAEILKLPPDETSTTSDGNLSEKVQSDKEQEAADDAASADTDGFPKPAPSKTAQVPGRSQQRRIASRETSSSIASNLASARGIRSKFRGQPLSPSVSNDQAPGNLDPHPRRDGSRTKMQSLIDHGKPAWVPPMPAESARPENRVKSAAPASPRTESAPAVVDDGGYTRFYNTFGSIMNKISAPLAFAGLPLIQEESSVSEELESPQTSPKRTRVRSSPTSSIDQDLSKIYSKATMRALVREGHNAHESFYVVPTSGHTMSYANILSYAEKEKRRLEASGHGSLEGQDEDDEDFVDARETLVPLSPGAKRRIGRARSGKELANTIEELSEENKSLKDMMDKLTKRLHAFEASAQNPAMALAESYRVMRPGSPMSPGSGKLGDDAARRRTKEIEEELAAATKHIERLEKDSRKMQKTLDKYREKWEVLKAGAKARRGAAGAGESVEDARQA